jgi:hypothetical protein
MGMKDQNIAVAVAVAWRDGLSFGTVRVEAVWAASRRWLSFGGGLVEAVGALGEGISASFAFAPDEPTRQECGMMG